MGDTKIEWTDKVWNPVRGCSRKSPGCLNCWAERQAIRHAGPGMPYEGLVCSTSSGPRWTGKVRLVEEMLAEPRRWTKPARVFVDSMSDLFHESLPREAISRVLGVMEECPQHTFQVLTKRPERLVEINRFGTIPANIWIGVSVEDEPSALERIAQLMKLHTKGVRFVCAGPLIAGINLQGVLPYCPSCNTPGDVAAWPCPRCNGRRLEWPDWFIIEGESGPGARPYNLAWPRALLRQCSAAGVPAFHKQAGSNPVVDYYSEDREFFEARDQLGELVNWNREDGQPPVGTLIQVRLMARRKGNDPNEWPEDLCVRKFPEVRRAA